jgi:hypothetical protein
MKIELRKKNMKMNEDYQVTETDIKYKDKDSVATIKILTGEYADIEFNFGEISFGDEENPDGTFTISFNYDILPEEYKNLQSDENFEKVVGTILNDLLLESINAAEKRYKDELRAENTKTPVDG